MALAFMMLAIYAAPEETQAITDKQIEENEIKQFEELSPEIHETKTKHEKVPVEAEEDSSSDSFGTEEETSTAEVIITDDATPKIEENEKQEQTETVPINEDAKVSADEIVPDHTDVEQDSSHHTMKPLVSGLIDDLQRRTQASTTKSVDDPFKKPTHRKHTWGGRGLERHH